MGRIVATQTLSDLLFPTCSFNGTIINLADGYSNRCCIKKTKYV
ncbi:hypothetical protein HanPI659440_Chr15g0616731 [Helianthus annuus]|nr:hypothetical protein HanPI659440_Chr15g0616731 [Helianthus annuus]